MPDFSGFQKLGSALAGGGALPAAMAEAQGEQLGANTQNAIAEAQLRQTKLRGLQGIGSATPVLAGAEQDPVKLGAALATFAQAGVDPREYTGAVHGNQENNSYNTIVNPDTTDAIVARHLVAEGKPGLIHEGAEGTFTNALHPDQGVQQTAVGQSLLQARKDLLHAQTNAANANATLHNTQAGHGGQGKAPSGYQWALDEDGVPVLDGNGAPTVVPIGGGPKDPDAPHAMGANQTNQFLRTVNASRQAVADLGNVMDMPVGANSGYFGSSIGGSAGHTIGGTLSANLSNKLNGSDVQQYNTVMSGLNQNLATLETFGLAPRGAFTSSMDRLAILPTDSEGTGLIKLAQARQIVEQALDTHIHDNPNLSQKQKDSLQVVRDQITNQIPYTVRDVLALQNSGNPQMTLAQLAKSRVGSPHGATPAAVPTPAPTAAGGPAVGAVERGFRFKGGDPSQQSSWEPVQ